MYVCAYVYVFVYVLLFGVVIIKNSIIIMSFKLNFGRILELETDFTLNLNRHRY